MEHSALRAFSLLYRHIQHSFSTVTVACELILVYSYTFIKYFVCINVNFGPEKLSTYFYTEPGFCASHFIHNGKIHYHLYSIICQYPFVNLNRHGRDLKCILADSISANKCPF